MEDKITVKVIDMVDITVGPKEMVPVIDIVTKSGDIVNHAFVFKTKESREEFMKLSGNSLELIKEISYKQGLRRGIILSMSIVVLSVIGGFTVAYYVDKVKNKKSKTDI